MRVRAAAIVAFLLAARTAHADPNDVQTPEDHTYRTVHWDEAWPHANVWSYSLAGVAATAFAVEGLALQWKQAPLRWTDPILFDEDVRHALRADNETTRDTVDAVSWGLIVAQIAYPLVVDVPYAWSRYGRRVANGLFWESALTLFLAGAVDFALRDLVGRARPEVYDCISRGGTNCVDNPEAVRSFPGGHTLTSTAASVLTCTQHLYVRIYGGAWDAATCAVTLASNVTVMAMRMVADSHWATDQIAGAAIGALIGWGVPYVMRYRFHTKPRVAILPTFVPVEHGAGLGAVGLF